MLNDPMFIVAAVLALAVAVVLIFGIRAYAKGGEYNRKYGNRLMRWRLYAQFLAVLGIVGFAWLRSRG